MMNTPSEIGWTARLMSVASPMPTPPPKNQVENTRPSAPPTPAPAPLVRRVSAAGHSGAAAAPMTASDTNTCQVALRDDEGDERGEIQPEPPQQHRAGADPVDRPSRGELEGDLGEEVGGDRGAGRAHRPSEAHRQDRGEQDEQQCAVDELHHGDRNRQQIGFASQHQGVADGSASGP